MFDESINQEIQFFQRKYPDKKINFEIITTEDLKKDSSIFISELRDELISELEHTEDTASLESKLDLSMFDDEEFRSLDEIMISDDFQQKLKAQKLQVDSLYNNDYIEAFQEDNDQSSLAALVEANRRLVLKIAQRYKGQLTNSIDMDDLEQFGMLGLMKAAEKFDLSKGFAFSTYATLWIRQSISRGIMDTSLTVRLPVHLIDKINKLTRLESIMLNEKLEVNLPLLTAEMNISIEQYHDLVALRNTYLSTISLDMPIGIDRDTTIGDMLPDNEYDIEKVIEHDFLRSDLEKLLDYLNEKERKIIDLRFGLKDGETKTLEEIGQMFGVTRERIRQIEAKAIRNLKKRANRELISDYYYTNGKDSIDDGKYEGNS
ncbi:TPA: sigma-70 family RNA polymerase sigma factor [Enterococcus faecium]|uniref:Sigma-70 family RNA polymerase sigma factor n=1 Tax=Enterococcus faecium TaxID=1352 RepID=A0AAW8RIW2_ENTFC|nr:sigma-70 family RNA polymerase sigma factor [Enterococcus faecium]MDK4466052.1 sigma-70 family RNA polymerase sigma factor [Enterococcus faecium]MDT2297516.1 sigma-70 family RNA polymerase sigma factor [Enterococcus faecium]MDT2299777.1 sigma-70 family RNA polymerase sigma factor [Enterococcus faecium]MDT2308967.1 sigma-70 family RNA polymerase sigma factor [Enterococcus faecium]MDT2330786.1 sigma-70 family RNA polymerase sigma factor [Enterococcus faecium]